MSLKPLHDRVLIKRIEEQENQDYLILREDEILGILSQNGQVAGKK
jgi:co-chaperonin GroES (HSP10)